MKFIINEYMEVKKLPKYNMKMIVLLILTIASMIVAFIMLLKQPSIKYVYHTLIDKQSVENDVKLNDSAILHELVTHGCVLSNVALAQAKLESNLGLSSVGKNAKNLFGITHHKCQYVSGKYGVYAKYNTYRDNIKCYIHIQDYYLRNIDGKYASADKYVENIRKYK